jgi:ATP-binding cassette subfamily F protein 3
MIQISNLSKAYGTQVLFENVTLSINAGERVGLVGRNGTGKTTLFRIILGLEHPDSGVISIPSGYRIGHLSQHVDCRTPTVLEEACLFLPHAEDGKDETFRAKAILLGLGFLTEDFARSPHELSGGLQVRLMLAQVLASDPNLLLLDDPTNYLDILSIRWLTRFLRSWKHEMILITHDREFMDSVTTHTMGIHRQKIRKIPGPTQKLSDQILMEEEVHERTRINDERKRKEVEEFIARFRAQATRARAVQSKIKALQRRERLEELTDARTLDFAFNDAPFLGKVLIEAQGVTFSFDRGASPLIEGLDIAVGPRDRIGIIGKNGKGKTTLLNLLAGELQPLEGQVVRHPQLRLAYFGQTNIDRLHPHKSVEEEIEDANPGLDRRMVRGLCGAMLFEGDSALKKIGVLSGGEKSRVLLGRLLASPANLLLLDEPTNHLDMESIDALLEALEVFEGAALLVTHSEMILKAVATRLVVFDRGTVRLFEGTYHEFLERVGWSDEAWDREPAAGVRQAEQKVNRKALRRVRAEIITNRSRVIGELQRKIAETEHAIMHLERDIAGDTDALLKATEKGDWQTIAKLSKSIHDTKERIDELFIELEDLTSMHDLKARAFDAQLGDLQQETERLQER